MVGLIVSIIIVTYGFELFLLILNDKNKKKALPENVSNIYEQTNYDNWLHYSMKKMKHLMAKRTLFIIVFIGCLLLNVFGLLEEWLKGIISKVEIQNTLFIIACILVYTLINIIFSYFEVFHIEEKFGFNRSSKKLFFFDQIKKLVLSLFIGGSIAYTVILLFYSYGINFIWFTWIGMAIIITLSFILNATLFVRIFNKLSPLPEGELKEKITHLASQVGFKVKSISVMNASKRSTKLNAFFSGFGRYRKVVLFDTLVNTLEDDEIIAVFAHELGHAKNKDTLRMLIQYIMVMGLYIWIAYIFASRDIIATSFGLSGAHFGFGLILVLNVIKPLQLLIDVAENYLSRKAEYRADQFAVKFGYKEKMITALKTLSKKNYANLNPHPAFVAVYYTHPPISKRLAAIEEK